MQSQSGKVEPSVAPRAGAWIEAWWVSLSLGSEVSLPVRERGLKRFTENGQDFVTKSLPVRERGLKLTIIAQDGKLTAALPVRERGLKLTIIAHDGKLTASLPVRERGLKPGQRSANPGKPRRSPCGSVD